ncbi:MAG: patatin-like phospholipase family protein [Paracoccaceae bacterium]
MGEATPLPEIDTLVFSGGGTRCFWHGGFVETVRGPLGLAPRRIAGVSGGALAAACFTADREETLLGVMGEAFERLDSNIDPHKIAEGKGLTPHQEVYREVVERVLDAEAVERVANGPAFDVMLAHPPSTRYPKWSTFPMMMAYLADLKIRSTPHMAWPGWFGVRRRLVDGRRAARDGRLVDLICNAAVIPPVFNIQRWDGEHCIDGGMASKAPIPEDDGDFTLILLTRDFRNLPRHPGRLYVTPSRDTPADKIDFTSREKIEATWRLGRRDGERFLADRGYADAS